MLALSLGLLSGASGDHPKRCSSSHVCAASTVSKVSQGERPREDIPSDGRAGCLGLVLAHHRSYDVTDQGGSPVVRACAAMTTVRISQRNSM